MSTKAIRTSIEESIERDECYLEDCEQGGRRQEAESVRNRIERARRALAEVEAIKKACLVLYRHGVVHSMRVSESEDDEEVDEAADVLHRIGRDQEAGT